MSNKGKGPKEPKELVEKQKQFCREYVIDWNATRAYAKVYDVKEKTAASSASRMLTIAKIKEYIVEIQIDLEKLAGISRLRILMEFMKIAFSNMADFNETWVTRKAFDQLTDEERACICEIKNEEIKGDGWTKEIIKIKLYDKQKALENINKMMGYNVPEESTITHHHQITGMKIV